MTLDTGQGAVLDLDGLREALRQPLPADWLQLLGDYPAALRGLMRSDGASVNQTDLVDDVDRIVALNAEVRYEPLVDVDGDSFDWPDHLIVIGENEYQFSALAGDRGFVSVTGRRCAFP